MPPGGWPGIVTGALALGLLSFQLAADPAVGVTFSQSPFTDEGWTTLGARNVVLLGRWATDEWQQYLVQLPFNVVVAGVFKVFGVGIIQARLVSVVVTAITVGLVAVVVTRRLGWLPGLLAGAMLATSTLLLYYGRLAVLEPMVLLLLMLVLVAWTSGSGGGRWTAGIAVGVGVTLALSTKLSSAAPLLGISAGGLAAAVSMRPDVTRLARRASIAMLVVLAAGAGWGALVLASPGAWESIVRVWPNQLPATSAAELVDRIITFPGTSDNALGYSRPLVAGAVAGTFAVVARWRSMDGGQRLLAGAAIGWLLVGVAVLSVVPYRPNRYLVPMLPPMAILSGYALAAVMAAAAETGWTGRRATRVALAATIGLAIVAALPGVRSLRGWMLHATYDLPRVQDEVLRLVNDGHAIQGAVTMAMRLPVPTIITQADVNAGDLYATHDVRWLLTNRSMTPAWAAAHPRAWARREVLVCYPWPSGEACLIRVP